VVPPPAAPAQAEPPPDPPPDLSDPRFRRYLQRLMAQLAKHKTYPPELKKQRLDGTVQVGFRIAADGTISQVRVVTSSGHRLLDDAAMAMVRNASPVPAIPSSLQRQAMTLVVPVSYTLQVD
jgi:protein TonB